MLDFAAIKLAIDNQIVTIPVKEWGGEVCIKTLTADEKDRYELEMLKLSEGQLGRVRALLVGLCLCDETGKRIVPDAEFEALGQKSASVLDKLYTECRKLNRLDGQDIDEAKKN